MTYKGYHMFNYLIMTIYYRFLLHAIWYKLIIRFTVIVTIG